MESISFREWLLLRLCVVPIVILIIVSLLFRQESSIQSISYMTVRVVGAVVQEKVLTMPSGSTFGDVLSKVKLAPDADIKKIPFDARLGNKQVVVIPAHAVVSVLIENQVGNRKVMRLPEGSTFLDLEKLVCFPRKNRKKRALKEGEVIVATMRENSL